MRVSEPLFDVFRPSNAKRFAVTNHTLNCVRKHSPDPFYRPRGLINLQLRHAITRRTAPMKPSRIRQRHRRISHRFAFVMQHDLAAHISCISLNNLKLKQTRPGGPSSQRSLTGLDFPGFARHQLALESNSKRGVYEGQTLSRRVQERGSQAGH